MVKKDIPVGFPMGIKINLFDLQEGLSLEKLIELTNLYHGGKYVIGYDTLYVDEPHYHIHWFAVKETSSGALKTFRTNVIKKSYPHISKSFRLYTGQDIPSAEPYRWISYCIKETLIQSEGFEITEEIQVQAKASLEIKKCKKVKSEQKANDEKEKKEFKEKMFDFVLKNTPDYQDKYGEYYGDEETAVKVTIVQYLIDVSKFGSIKEHFIHQYYLEYKVNHAQEKWTAKQVYMNIKKR